MIKTKLKADSVEALKGHNSRRVEVLRFLISVIEKKELLLPPDSLKEEDEINALRKELKNKEESREVFSKGNRMDLVAEMDEEISIVKEYLPKEIDESEVIKVVDEILAEVSGANFGQVMGMVMKKMAGRVSGDVVSRIVKERF